jgi:hypothetical protein
MTTVPLFMDTLAGQRQSWHVGLAKAHHNKGVVISLLARPNQNRWSKIAQ